MDSVVRGGGGDERGVHQLNQLWKNPNTLHSSSPNNLHRLSSTPLIAPEIIMILKAKLKFPDRFGRLVSQDKDEENVGSDNIFESGEELATFQPNGFGLDREIGGDDYDHDDPSVLRQKQENEVMATVSASEVIAADEKRSDLEYEGICLTPLVFNGIFLNPSLSQKEINLEKLQRIASTGLPDGGGLRATTWKSEFSRRNDEASSSPNEQYTDSDIEGPLERHDVSNEDHPLSLGKASAWHQYFQFTEILEQIDRDLQRTHPDMKVFSGDTVLSRKNRANAEADSFSCFVRLLSDSVDHFCEQLDNSSVGIHSTLSRLSELLKFNDEELWHHLEFTTKVNPQFYAFRWITLLLTQEFDFQSILRIWDSLLSNAFGVQMAQILLHGTLHATIYEIDKLHAAGVQKIFHKWNVNNLLMYGFGEVVSDFV
ncbi:hypothetical protein LguiB_011577 [Lonicera macranthoides]